MLAALVFLSMQCHYSDTYFEGVAMNENGSSYNIKEAGDQIAYSGPTWTPILIEREHFWLKTRITVHVARIGVHVQQESPTRIDSQALLA